MIYRTEITGRSDVSYETNKFLRIFSQLYSASGYSGNQVIEVNSPFEFITYFPDYEKNRDLKFLKSLTDIGYALYVQNTHESVNTPSLCLYTDQRVSTSVLPDRGYKFSVNAVENIAIKIDITGWKKGSWFLLYSSDRFTGFLVWCGDPNRDIRPIDSRMYFGELAIPEGLTYQQTIDRIINGLGLNSVFVTERINEHTLGIGSSNAFININQFSGIKSIEYYPWMINEILSLAFYDKRIIEFTSKVKSDHQDSFVNITRSEGMYFVSITRVSGGIVTLSEEHIGNKEEIIESLHASTLVDINVVGDIERLPIGKFPLYSMHKEEFEYRKDNFIDAINNLNSNVLPDYVYDYGIKNLGYYNILKKKFEKSIILCRMIDKPEKMCLYYTDQKDLKGNSTLYYLLNSLIKDTYGKVDIDGLDQIPNGKNENYVKKSDSYFYIDPLFYHAHTRMFPLPYNFVTFTMRSILREQIVHPHEASQIIDDVNIIYKEYTGRNDSVKIKELQVLEQDMLNIVLEFNVKEYSEPEIINLNLTI